MVLQGFPQACFIQRDSKPCSVYRLNEHFATEDGCSIKGTVLTSVPLVGTKASCRCNCRPFTQLLSL